MISLMNIPSLKSKTKKLPIKEIPATEYFMLSLKGYGSVMKPLVNQGDEVKKYQLLAENNNGFYSCLHAPASGVIESIQEIEGEAYIKLRNDFKDTETILAELHIENMAPEDILNVIKYYGIEGSGGARFPTYTKYNTLDSSIDTFIINGAECEPYLSADYALMNHETESLFKAVEIIQKVIGASRIVIGIEHQHKKLKSNLEQSAQAFHLPFEVKILPDQYPQGGELQLIRSVTGKELPKGSIPAQHGIMVSNVGTIHAIYEAFYNNRPYTERTITVSGENSSEPGNYKVSIGTPIKHILEHLGGSWNPKQQTVVLGGPMMGKAVHHADTAIHKGSGGVLVIPHPKNNRHNCIQCGYCSDVCPQHLMPMEFARYTNENNPQKLQDFHLPDCIECGACAYICPSDVPLMKSIFNGKEMIKNLHP
ncbi:electron transport complex subunit RsxC [Fulvivirga maritima]|uniref:electron transport complex subunit RsxC n=1 Tax=Fulvivirga maritima TaxID=2904247 RepID=UPI001F2CF530|nr:electron transport complex subunit RsxC [Fulvivirga maritima]UII25957.1 electron transport complex subunit RsxC [Fulvivirga maritima]